MANLLSVNLRFLEENFRELDAPNLFVNLWTYNCFKMHKPCIICDTYFRFCEKILKERWCDDWGNFDSVVEKIKNCDGTFININNYSKAIK